MTDRDPAIVECLEKGQELFNDKKFFEAHEVWEEVWGDSQLEDRHLLQGLIQVAAGFYKLQTGMPTGTVKLLDKSLGHLRAVPANYYGVDLETLMPAVEAWRDRAKVMVEQWRTDYPVDELPRLEWTPEARH